VVKAIHRFASNFWFHWTADVNAVRGPVAGDTQERTYFTGDGVPKVTDASIATSGGGTDYPNVSYTLGVPAPGTTPTVALGAGGGCDVVDQLSVTFVYRYVTGWKEEGVPSDPSTVVNVCDGQTVTINAMEAGPTGAYNVTTKRIYADIGGGYKFLVEIPVANTSYEITAFDATVLNEDMVSEDWYPPPADMHSLIMMPNGFAAGLSKSSIVFSEPYQLHAWPPSYDLAMDSDGVAIASAGQSIVAVTEATTYLVTGIDPASMGMQKLEANQSCVSKRSMVDMGQYVVYASPDGLVAASDGGGVSLVTDQLMTRDQWQALNPSSINAYQWEGLYIGFYDTGVVQNGFIFDPSAKDGLIFLDFHATAGFNDATEDALYLVVGSDIVQFNAGTALSYIWKSKLFITPKPINFGAAQVLADAYPVTFKLYAGGVLKFTKTVADTKGFRLPGGYLATDWEATCSGSNTINAVYIAETMRELGAI
jgi:hypothetical protein